MGSTWDQVVEELGTIPGYVEQFAAVYDDGITEANVTSPAELIPSGCCLSSLST